MFRFGRGLFCLFHNQSTRDVNISIHNRHSSLNVMLFGGIWCWSVYESKPVPKDRGCDSSSFIPSSQIIRKCNKQGRKDSEVLVDRVAKLLNKENMGIFGALWKTLQEHPTHLSIAFSWFYWPLLELQSGMLFWIADEIDWCKYVMLWFWLQHPVSIVTTVWCHVRPKTQSDWSRVTTNSLSTAKNYYYYYYYS